MCTGPPSRLPDPETWGEEPASRGEQHSLDSARPLGISGRASQALRTPAEEVRGWWTSLRTEATLMRKAGVEWLDTWGRHGQGERPPGVEGGMAVAWARL